jgi:predicted branched-subunit amino acid permease
MLAKYFDTIEAIGLDLFFAFIFIFIGLSIRDILKKNDIPPMGKAVIYLVLCLGCLGFVIKGVIQIILEHEGVG